MPLAAIPGAALYDAALYDEHCQRLTCLHNPTKHGADLLSSHRTTNYPLSDLESSRTMNLVDTVFGCLKGRAGKAVRVRPINEKAGANYTDKSEQDIAGDVLNALRSAEKSGSDLERTLKNIVGEYGWTENIAKAILNGLENMIKTASSMGQALKEAIEKAASAAVEFAREHPVYTTIIALGVLVLLMPWVIEALGFGELGPIEGKLWSFNECRRRNNTDARRLGTFASWWQSRYAGYVPKGSLFSYFQRLGMTWKVKA
ncbi:hypothetical protein GP486_004135 [Trichoglossum hirsutum]|uniref:Uncharacterized protein n=1 Tax=Trichoglossum hirsutum TaxID=265104 RepID=A0A9P8LBQ3_9PEZI|nr:hypothetical protein GP486_004135 [Trichoglossum hirsutum]